MWKSSTTSIESFLNTVVSKFDKFDLSNKRFNQILTSKHICRVSKNLLRGSINIGPRKFAKLSQGFHRTVWKIPSVFSLWVDMI